MRTQSERLRKKADGVEALMLPTTAQLMREAADDLDRLEAERTILRDACLEWAEVCKTLEQERDEALRKLQEPDVYLQKALARVKKLEQERDRLLDDIIADFSARCRCETVTVLPGLLFATGLLEQRRAAPALVSPVLAFQEWAERRTALRGPMTQDEYFLAQEAFFAAHPGKGPQSSVMTPAPALVEKVERAIDWQMNCYHQDTEYHNGRRHAAEDIRRAVRFALGETDDSST